MSKLQALLLLWPPVPCAVFVAMTDWIASFGSTKLTFVACVIFVYAVFAPLLIEALWPKKRGAT